MNKNHRSFRVAIKNSNGDKYEKYRLSTEQGLRGSTRLEFRSH